MNEGFGQAEVGIGVEWVGEVGGGGCDGGRVWGYGCARLL